MPKIELINVGRNKVNKVIEVEHTPKRPLLIEEVLAEMAYEEVQKHLLSRSSVYLEPNEQKGAGWWIVGAGFHNVGEVKITI